MEESLDFMLKGRDFRASFYYKAEFSTLAEGHESLRKITSRGKLSYFSLYFRKKYRVAFGVTRCHPELLGK